MARKDRMSGNEAVSFAIRQINPDVMPAFPITPSTEIPQMVSTYIANGEIDTEFVPVESEHSAMSAAIGSEAAGARTLTATSSAGLALMWEEFTLKTEMLILMARKYYGQKTLLRTIDILLEGSYETARG